MKKEIITDAYPYKTKKEAVKQLRKEIEAYGRITGEEKKNGRGRGRRIFFS